MVNEVKLNELKSVYELGKILSDKFDKLYNLEEICNEEYSHIYVYKENDEILGFIHITKLYEVTDIVNIAINKNNRHRGIGSILLDYVISEFPDVKIITLEVNVNNLNAINMYKKFGFKIVNVRKNYYNNEDAYLMERCIL